MRRLVLALVGISVAAAALTAAERLYDGPGPLTHARIVIVPRGGMGNVGETLARAGVIGNKFVFEAAAFATAARGRLHAAELLFPAGASIAAVLDVLRFAAPVRHRITIPEGLSAAQISSVLVRGYGVSGDLTVPNEGSFLPDTYEYTFGTAVAAIIGRGRETMSRVLQTAWSGRAGGLPLGSRYEALVLASIVEREAKLPSERKMIARVFLNRLAQHMRLQADPTVIYAASGGTGVLDRKLVRDDLAAGNPYNTYVRDGLPPTPICSPGAAAVEAVLHPADGDALYFVSDNSGGHVFARSLAEHNANVGRFRNFRK